METDVLLVTLALHTLGTFNFGRHPHAVCGELCSELPHFGRHGDTDGSRQDLRCSPSAHAAAGGAAGAPYPVISTASNHRGDH